MECRPFQITTGEALIIIELRQFDPALVCLALDVSGAHRSLARERRHLLTGRAFCTLSRVDCAPNHIRHRGKVWHAPPPAGMHATPSKRVVKSEGFLLRRRKA